MNTNEIKFVELIKNHPMQYRKKLDLVVKLNVVSQMSRNMLIDLADIYQLVNPQYNVKMLNVGCGACVLSFMKDVATIYFKLEDNVVEVVSDVEVIEDSVEPLITIEAPIEVEVVDTLSEDLERMTNEDVIIEEEAPVIPKKRGRPFSKNLPN